MIGRLFEREDPRPAALMRVGLGIVLLWDALLHWPYVVELYSTDGMPMPFFPGTRFEPIALDATCTVLLYSLLLFALFAVAAGWRTRMSLVLAFGLFAWFGLLDMAGTFKKFSVIALHLLALLAFTQSQAVWSVDAWFRGARSGPVSPKWPRLLMRVLLTAVYLGAAVTKLRMREFFNGDVLMFSLLDERWGGNWLGMWLATRPKLLILLSFGTILLEFSAAILLWIPATRRTMLLLAALFHAGIGLTMHVGVFSPVMFVALIAFVTEEDLAAIGNRLRRFLAESWVGRIANPSGRWSLRRQPRPISKPSYVKSVALYGLCAVLFAGIGFAWQYATDESGAFQPADAKPWRAVDKETEQSFLVGRRGGLPEVEDYFHRIDVGSRIGFRQVFGHADVFHRGETVHVVGRVVRRRVQLQLVWVLIGPEGVELARYPRLLEPAFDYVSFDFLMKGEPDELPTGEYTIVLEAAVPNQFGYLVENPRPVFRHRFRLE